MEKKSSNAFEKLLIIIGVLVLFVGYFFINKAFVEDNRQITWDFLQTVFLWLLMVIFIMVLAIGEDIKTNILREQVEEIKSLRQVISKKKNR